MAFCAKKHVKSIRTALNAKNVIGNKSEVFS